MATLSRIEPPRSAVITRTPASSGPSTTLDHSSALKSAFLVTGVPSVDVDYAEDEQQRSRRARRCRSRGRWSSPCRWTGSGRSSWTCRAGRAGTRASGARRVRGGELREGATLVWAFNPIRARYLYKMPATAEIVEFVRADRVTWEVKRTGLPRAAQLPVRRARPRPLPLRFLGGRRGPRLPRHEALLAGALPLRVQGVAGRGAIALGLDPGCRFRAPHRCSAGAAPEGLQHAFRPARSPSPDSP